MAPRKAQQTEAIPEVSWFVTGRGKTANYYAAVPEAIAAEGATVALVAKTGAITYGTLRAPAADLDDKATARIPEGVAVWTFKKDNARMTAELRADNAALKMEARAAFLRSPAGIAQAERIAARAAKREAEAGIPDTKTVTVTVDPAIMAPAAPAAEAPGFTIADYRDAGFTIADMMEAGATFTVAEYRAAGYSAGDIMAAAPKPVSAPKPAAGKPAAGKPAAAKPISLAALNAKAGTRGK